MSGVFSFRDAAESFILRGRIGCLAQEADARHEAAGDGERL